MEAVSGAMAQHDRSEAASFTDSPSILPLRPSAWSSGTWKSIVGNLRSSVLCGSSNISPLIFIIILETYGAVNTYIQERSGHDTNGDADDTRRRALFAIINIDTIEERASLTLRLWTLESVRRPACRRSKLLDNMYIMSICRGSSRDRVPHQISRETRLWNLLQLIWYCSKSETNLRTANVFREAVRWIEALAISKCFI